MTLVEGRNRIVRRWAEAIGLKVDRLARLSYGPVRLGDLPSGRSRPLTPREESALYKAIRMDAGRSETGGCEPRSSGERDAVYLSRDTRLKEPRA